MNIEGTITSVEYDVRSNAELKEVDFKKIDINNTHSCFLLNMDNTKIAVSKWVSPKRTRSYPYERVYNTLSTSKKITIIPVVKDEGATGDRDFIQWDTIALMSLLDVYVILAYYKDAVRRTTSSGKIKITKQKLDNDFVLKEIKKLRNYHSSALHWNLEQIESLPNVVKKVKSHYKKIAEKTGVKLKSEKGIDDFLTKISRGATAFKDFSRQKAEEAQKREFVTIQPKEALSTLSKAKITIKNYLGGLYYFTVDEVELIKTDLRLIEAKHTNSGKIPTKGDIKDGLLKMMLYSNLEKVKVDGLECSATPVLKLTASKMIGKLKASSGKNAKTKFYKANKITDKNIDFLNAVFEEANINNFEVILEKA